MRQELKIEWMTGSYLRTYALYNGINIGSISYLNNEIGWIWEKKPGVIMHETILRQVADKIILMNEKKKGE